MRRVTRHCDVTSPPLNPGDFDALFWHRPGEDDMACFRIHESLVVVRILSARTRIENEVFSIWDPFADDWIRTSRHFRRHWSDLVSATDACLQLKQEREAR